MAFAKLSPEEEIIPNGYKIKASGVFDINELYEEMHRWFIHFGYDWKETRYLASDLPNNTRVSEVSWVCTRKVDEYVSYVLELHYKATTSEVEVTIDNTKKMMSKGSVEFRFKGTMEKKISIWEKKLFGKLLGLIYEKLLIKNRLDDIEDTLAAESQQLFTEIKTYLQIR